MSARIFIDGEAGTTGLQIKSRLENRNDIELVSLGEDRRKDAGARAEALNGVDVAILCLPDDAAREAVSWIENPDVKVIDASSAHRTADGWVYGFAEMDGEQGGRIATANRVTNPGCYAISSVSILYPLVTCGLLPASHPATINAISGYTGGGKPLIANFETDDGEFHDTPFFVYGLGLDHKHIPEIQGRSGLERRPLFVPSVGHFAQGMIVQVPLQLWALPDKPSARDVHDALAKHYEGARFVRVAPMGGVAEQPRLFPEAFNGTNDLALRVYEGDGGDQALVVAQLDNLGKGASGSCVQNLNIMLGLDEGTGL